MTARRGGGDARVLAAAARISDAYGRLGDEGRSVADEQLSDYPALASDPRLAGPLLIESPPDHRRTAQLLTAAGGADLQDAAGRLAGWVEPVMEIADLEQRLGAWLPDSTAETASVKLTRRLLCDAAGLARTPWSTHVVSVAALEEFARAARDHTDDAELIDEDALLRAVVERGWDGAVVEALCEVCGFERLFGSLATRRNRFSLSKAALLDLRRSASRHEVAALTGLTPAAVGMAFSTCASIVRTGYNRWAAHHDPRFVAFAAAAAELADDVGLIDEARLRTCADR